MDLTLDSSQAQAKLPAANVQRSSVFSFRNIFSPDNKRSKEKSAASSSDDSRKSVKNDVSDQYGNVKSVILNSFQDFVIIPPLPKSPAVLTKHQREVARNRKQNSIPALYNDLDATQASVVSEIDSQR